MDPFFFDRASLVSLGASHREEFAAAQPFPHAVFDDFLPAAVAEQAFELFPAVTDGEWTSYQHSGSVKLATPRDDLLPPYLRSLLREFNSSVFIDFLEALTGIRGLISDPHYEGGGLHQIPRGGFLKVHSDFLHHPRLGLDRRLNAILYLNPGWLEGWNGGLEFWNQQMQDAVATVLPVFNRLVVFETTEKSFHGHPEPLLCPPENTRKSMALYYYTSDISAIPQQRRGTVYRNRPGEKVAKARTHQIRRWIPSAILDGVQSVRERKSKAGS